MMLSVHPLPLIFNGVLTAKQVIVYWNKRGEQANERYFAAMGGQKMVLVMLLIEFAILGGSTDCSTTTALLSACSSFITNGSPDPMPESPCCVAITTLNNLSNSFESRQVVCKCLMELITDYSPNATAVATLPGFCGVSFGFTIDPNTDCEYIP